MKNLIAIVLCGGFFIGGCTPAKTVTPEATRVPSILLANIETPMNLSESDLERIGLSKEEAKKLINDIFSIVEREKDLGNISTEEAQAFSSALLTTPADEGITQFRGLPVWAAAAIVGCAGSVMLGEGKKQVKNACSSRWCNRCCS